MKLVLLLLLGASAVHLRSHDSDVDDAFREQEAEVAAKETHESVTKELDTL